MYVCMNGWMDGELKRKKKIGREREREDFVFVLSEIIFECVFPFLATLRRETINQTQTQTQTHTHTQKRKKTYPKPIPF